ncbi:hypothetical protein [uncultured Algimonas sp.]|uniref:hypothetical protein n=1 Tax=uncultured Algimonas sp. TaxID=1547920 RepID=UPI0026271BD5|nr:hypothetical protein [uncultured Algimonas sp.]
MSEERFSADGSHIALAICAGSFVWLVFDSLVFGALASVATFLLLIRDAKADGEGGEE